MPKFDAKLVRKNLTWKCPSWLESALRAQLHTEHPQGRCARTRINSRFSPLIKRAQTNCRWDWLSWISDLMMKTGLLNTASLNKYYVNGCISGVVQILLNKLRLFSNKQTRTGVVQILLNKYYFRSCPNISCPHRRLRIRVNKNQRNRELRKF